MKWEYQNVIHHLVENNRDIVEHLRERSTGILMGMAMMELRGRGSGEEINEELNKQITRKLRDIDRVKICKAFNWWEGEMFDYVYHDGNAISIDIPYENELAFIGEHFKKHGARWCVEDQQWEFGRCMY